MIGVGVRRLAAGGLLSAPVAALLWVPWYARERPYLVGVPFFYWYQFLWVPLSVLCMIAAYLLLYGRKRTSADPTRR
ncbi:hypothetical protein GCM10027290_02920 [Micromonospora sonneratiae]|uniref:DUF3311 domain-containing protein n=1 Tax=Micromonospora sonneratiae TaxID=1184706 RepID=A0ABW3Y6Z0_9ACTN